MSRRLTIFILIILLVGVFYRLSITANGNFLFNMDNARDMVDVREMVVLKKLRLTGPTSAIEGLFNGPGWYYLLAVPFILSGGNPYASILTEIILWTIGGFFLLKLVSRWGSWLVIPIGAIWVASDYIVLANRYAFNPNPVTLLAPLLIYLLVEYLKKGQAIYGILTWFLAGLFFNFEMNFGVFMPVIIFSGIIMTKNTKLLKQKRLWLGFSVFILTLLPQLIFDFKHQFIMSNAIFRHLSQNPGDTLNILERFQIISTGFYNTFLPILMNHKIFAGIILLLFIPLIFIFLKDKRKESLVWVSLIFIFAPFLGYLILPVTVNAWHLGGEMAAAIILIAYLLKHLINGGFVSKAVSLILSVLIVWFGVSSIGNFFVNEFGKPNLDPSLLKNEIAAIDYVYKYANGQNFKVYEYLPSVYDYPYQYLIWWYGQQKFDYLPIDYAYAPNKPQLISNKQFFSATAGSLAKRENSNLIFLIKEPDQNDTRSGWEGDFAKLESVGKQMIGPLEIEVKREVRTH